MPMPDTDAEQSFATDSGKSARCAVIINRQSGTVSEVWDDAFSDELIRGLQSNGWDPELHLLEGSEISDTVKRLIDERPGAIISGGGDGTTTSMAEMLRGPGIPLGILPFGTLNLAARDLNTPLDPLEAIRSFKPGRTRNIDVLDVNGHACLCVTFLGFYPVLLKRNDEVHTRSWWMKFWKLGMRLTEVYYRSPRLRITLDLDGQSEQHYKTRLLAIVPGRYEEAFNILPKRDELQSGEFHVYTSRHKTRWSAVRMAFSYLKGSPATDPDLDVVTAKNMRVAIHRNRSNLVAIDGEVYRLEVPIEVKLMEEALTVLDPLNADAKEQ